MGSGRSLTSGRRGGGHTEGYLTSRGPCGIRLSHSSEPASLMNSFPHAPPTPLVSPETPSLQESPPQALSRGHILRRTTVHYPVASTLRLPGERGVWAGLQQGFYELPVLFILETPTPRHTSRDCSRAKLEGGAQGAAQLPCFPTCSWGRRGTEGQRPGPGHIVVGG